jgi:hypothetical protein
MEGQPNTMSAELMYHSEACCHGVVTNSPGNRQKTVACLCRPYSGVKTFSGSYTKLVCFRAYSSCFQRDCLIADISIKNNTAVQGNQISVCDFSL